MKRLNFGCGDDIRKYWINCDVQKGENVISFDFDEFPYPFKANSFDFVECKHVIYFLEKPKDVMYELRRICKDGAKIKITYPYWNNKGYFTTINARYIMNENAFDNFVNKSCCIEKEKYFEIIDKEIIPTWVGRYFPAFFRNWASVFISGLNKEIIVELKVIK